jgi:APA family basic amino acid/polyamine antiporter
LERTAPRELALPAVNTQAGAPRPSLGMVDGVAMLVGIVVGIGIFRTPQIVAANVGSEWAFIAVWLAGGVITLIGAFIYAELGSAYPHTGGEYHFLHRGIGKPAALLFAWARLTVIQTGAIAAVAFVFGDYAQQILPLGGFGSALYAAGAIVLFTLVNLSGSTQSRGAQRLFTALTVGGVLLIALLGLILGGAPATPPAAPADTTGGAVGLAMVLVLLTYGGWNEAAYLSAEMKDVRRNMPRVLMLSILAIVALYLLINLAYLRVLGLDGLRQSDVVGADTMRSVLGDSGSVALALALCCAALSTLNATIFTGARLYYSIGRDLPLLGRIGLWEARGNMPINAIIAQSVIALALVGFGASTRVGFQAIVEYTAPVFWFFLLLVGIAFFVLRHRDPPLRGAFRAPLYPLTPAIFCLTCAYLFYSSLAYTGLGALVGVAVLLLGLPVILFDRTLRTVPCE